MQMAFLYWWKSSISIICHQWKKSSLTNSNSHFFKWEVHLMFHRDDEKKKNPKPKTTHKYHQTKECATDLG